MNKRSSLLLTIIWSLLAVQAAIAQNDTVEKISEPFKYEGYSEPQYESWATRSEFITLSDGVKIAVDILIPSEGPPLERFPVLFQHTPYNRAYLVPKMGPIKHVVSRSIGFGWGPAYDQGDIFPYIKLLLSHGYVIVNADMRGTGASFGTQMPLMPQLASDGKELIDWISSQSWCDGNVGMMGPSYLGWAQYLAASRKPEALKCIMPEVIIFDAYTEANCPGGIHAQEWLEGFSDMLEALNRSQYKLRKGYVPALPAIDEDGDGDLHDERPVLDSAMLAGVVPLKYPDKSERTEHYYFKATQEHLENVLVRDLMAAENSDYFDGQSPEPYDSLSYIHGSPGYYVPEIAESGIPIYHMGGWYDIFVKGTSKHYATLSKTNPSKLLMAPRFHLPVATRAYKKYLGFEGKYSEMHTVEQLRFFDHYLKGIDNGIDHELPVYIYVMNQGWRAEEEWPLKRQKMTPFYLLPNGNMGIEAGEDGEDNYKVDFAVSSDYGKDSLNRWKISEGFPLKLMKRTELDKRCLVYETQPLAEEMEMTGHPIIRLWVSSNQDYGDVFVYLSDVDEEGEVMYITEGMLRAGWHRLVEDDDQVNGRVDVQPELPWHGYKKEQFHDKALGGNQVVELTFDLLPSSWLFRKGHKIRIAIAGADFQNFQLNPGLCPDGEPATCEETIISVHRSNEHPSRIILPIIPPKPPVITEKEASKLQREAGAEDGRP